MNTKADTAERGARRRVPATRLDGATAGHALLLDRITHRFGAFTAVNDITLDIRGGELLALLGPSGCGKTTLLRIIAGFVRQSRGEVKVDGTPIDHLAPNLRNVGIVFQNYALFPHMTVAENVAYGLAARHWQKARITAKVDEMLALVQLQELRQRLPRQLSGGQQQRAAIARAMAVEPKILLLDEPFGALDKNLRLDMQIEVKRIQRDLGITTILVTHDQEEALSLADRIAVINHGRLEQLSPPGDLYHRPETLFVNQFVGTTNLVPARIATTRNAEVTGIVTESGARLACLSSFAGREGQEIWFSVRPEQLVISAASCPPANGGMTGEIVAIMPLGPTVVFEVRTRDGTSIKITQPSGAGSELKEGDQAVISLAKADACSIFDRSPEPNTSKGDIR